MIGGVTLLNLLQLVGPAVAATSTFVKRFEVLIADHSDAEQSVLKEALAEVQKGNDKAHGDLQEKLAKAALKK